MLLQAQGNIKTFFMFWGVDSSIFLYDLIYSYIILFSYFCYYDLPRQTKVKLKVRFIFDMF